MTEQAEPYDLPPLAIAYSNPITGKAWEILHQAEIEVLAISMAQERASYHTYLCPEEPGEYLWWMLDEAEVQEASGHTEYASREREGYNEYGEACTLAYQEAAILRRYAIDLLTLGIQPMSPTTRREEKE